MVAYKHNVEDAVLGEFSNYGFKLLQPNENTVELWYRGKLIASLNASKVTVAIVREGCRNYLASVLQQDYRNTCGEELGRIAND